MSERDVFERRLEASVRDFVEAAPTQIDAARLTDSLATSVPRVRRLVPRPGWRLPDLGRAWIIVAAALLAMMGLGLVASGALRMLDSLPVTPTPSLPLQSPPAIIVTPAPTPAASSLPIGIVVPSTYVGEQARFQAALAAAGYGGLVLVSEDTATEKADVEALLRQGIRVLILCPQDRTRAAAAADEARAAGARVIANDRLLLGTAVDYYVTFDNARVGGAQARYLVDRAGAARGNSLYLYAGAAADNNAFLILEGAWERLQPRFVDGTFVIRNSSEAVALRTHPTLTRDQLSRIIGQVTTNWDPATAATLASGNLATTPAADKGTAFVLAPNDATALAIAAAFAADKGVTRAYVTGQDADTASVQAIIDGRQGMTVFKDPRERVNAAVAAAVAYLRGETPAMTTTVGNDALDVPADLLGSVAVTRANLQAALFDTGFYRAGDFTGTWPGKP